MEDRQHQSDEVLAKLREEFKAGRRGRVKIFFGYAAGIGKTYSMLEAARAQAAAGVDVAMGYVEPHARPETEALMAGLEHLAPRIVEYKGIRLKEFDLDAALARKPAVLVVDELAHTNVPGSRHAKRWQDVMELLEAGINVYTTLNVQHIETLNDIVAQFSGVQVRETVPDTIFDQADEIELVDLPPDELLQRLTEGKVYLPERAAVAQERFFQKSNLVVLRELALRRTADRVNIQAEAYRHAGKVVPTTERLLVCVGPSPFSARLVRSAARMALSLRCPWLAVSVDKTGTRMSQEAQDRVWANLRMAALLGAETAALTGPDVVAEILSYARARHASKIIVGKPLLSPWRDWMRRSLVHEIVRQCGSIDVYVISGEEAAAPRPVAAAAPRAPAWSDYLLAVLAVAACSGVGELLTDFDLSLKVMIYLMGVIAVALRGRRGPALLASVLSASALNFFFIPPLYSFTLANPVYWLTVLVLAATGVVVSTLVVRIRQQADSARHRELRTVTLYSMSKDLATAATIAQVVELAAQHVGLVLDCDVRVLLPDESEKVAVQPAAAAEAHSPAAQDLAVAQWVWEHAQLAGLGTDTLPASPWLFAPLAASGACWGVIGLRPHNLRALPPDQVQLLTTLSALIAAALERIKLSDRVRQSQVQVEAEQMRSALLSSVSHDLRTPLTGIIGAAGTLAESIDTLSPQVRSELLATISDEAQRVDRLVSNLLDMTRLESGQVTPSREWLPVEELVGSSVRRCAKRLADRDLRVTVPPDLPMLYGDSVLMEQVLVNLLDNAAKYSPAASAIEISARADAAAITIVVADRGPGVPKDQQQSIFEKFVRGKDAAKTAGVGLGLAICKAIVTAHGGKIWVEDRPGGGAAFGFSLPRCAEPQVREETP